MNKPEINLRTLLIVLATIAFICPAVGGYLYYSTLSQSSIELAHKDAEEHLKDLGNDIDTHLTWSLRSAKSLAGLKELRQSLLQADVVALAETDAVLDHFCEAIKVSVCYLMGPTGNTIASSNRNAPDSFVGKNYRFRPYFKQAMKGIPTVYMALGITSKKRGIYFSHPVYEKGQGVPLGVVVIKASAERIEKNIIKARDGIVLLTDPHGVIFFSNRPAWLYHLLWKAPSDTVSKISTTRQFGKGPWAWTGLKKMGKDTAVDNQGNEYRVHQQILGNYPDWQLVNLHNRYEVSEKISIPLQKSVGMGVVAVCLFFGLIVFFLFRKANTSIVQRKETEKKLQENEAFIKSVMDNLPIGIAVNSVDPSVEFEYMNDNFPKFYRTTREKLADPDIFWDVVYEEPEFREKIKKRVLDDCASGDPERMHWEDVPITRAGGETSFITAGNTPIPDKKLMISTIFDVTKRKQTEEALRESEKRYREFMENAVIGFFQVDEQGKIRVTNRKMAEILGYASSVDLLRDVDNVTRLYAYPEERSKILQEINESGHIEGREVEFKGKSSKKVWIKMSTRVTADRDGKKVYEGLMEDITHRKQMEEEQKRLEDHLQQAYKMEAIGTLAGGIAHDFNNILTPIIVHSELALMDIEKKNPIRFNLQEVMKAGLRAKELVKQILAFSRQSEQQPVPLKITPIIKETIKLLRASLPTTIEIRLNLIEEEDTIIADPTQIHQVLMNLCTNASHAMQEKGGVLDIELSDLYLDSKTCSSFEDLGQGSYLRLTVKDTGHGIDPELIGRIFDPYFTTKESGKGTGMGLSVVHGIVKSNNGDITVDSEPGKGTIFQVLFPKFDESIPSIVKPEGQLPRGTERILLVDDEKAAVDVIRSMLEKLGYKVTARTDSIEAFEAFESRPGSFDLVITDMTMPKMTGRELAEKLMALRPDIPIILCTGFSQKVDKKSAEEMGINAFVMKPIIMHEIANTIRDILDNV